MSDTTGPVHGSTSTTSTAASANQVLATSTGAIAPTGTSFNATIPVGGATSVTWSLNVTGVNALGTISFEGDGCAKKTSSPGNQVGGVHLDGTCADLAAGIHSFTVSSSQGGGSYTVTIKGNVRN